MSDEANKKVRGVDPEAYGADCRPGPSAYPRENADALMPDHIREAIAKREAKPKAA